MKLLQAQRPQFGISHDQTSVELAEKKTYDALKIQIEEKMSAGEKGWKIRRDSNGLANFCAP